MSVVGQELSAKPSLIMHLHIRCWELTLRKNISRLLASRSRIRVQLFNSDVHKHCQLSQPPMMSLSLDSFSILFLNHFKPHVRSSGLCAEVERLQHTCGIMQAKCNLYATSGMLPWHLTR